MGVDVCLAFLSGFETFVDKTLQGALRTVEDLEVKAQHLADSTRDSGVSLISSLINREFYSLYDSSQLQAIEFQRNLMLNLNMLIFASSNKSRSGFL